MNDDILNFDDTNSTINSFQGSYSFLSNFYPSPVVVDGITYPTVEHGYQASKTFDKTQRSDILAADTPGKAKRLGKLVNLRPDWNDVKLSVMENLLRQKFHKDTLLYKMLRHTRGKTLIEGNYWGDTFWGVSRGRGENHLGKLLMSIRDE